MVETTTKSSVLLKSLLYFALIGTIFGILPFILWIFTKELVAFSFGTFRFLGFIPLVFGVAFTFWEALYFPLHSKGTPAHSDPPKMLATEGLFRFTRNPMYVGATLTIIGQAILFESPTILLLAILIWLLLHLLVVYYEEPNLRKRFGKLYEEYARAVPRWIIRRVRARKQD